MSLIYHGRDSDMRFWIFLHWRLMLFRWGAGLLCNEVLMMVSLWPLGIEWKRMGVN